MSHEELAKYIQNEFDSYCEQFRLWSNWRYEKLKSNQSPETDFDVTSDIQASSNFGQSIFWETPDPAPAIGIPTFNAGIFAENILSDGGKTKDLLGSATIIASNREGIVTAITSGHVICETGDRKVYLSIGEASAWEQDVDKFYEATLIWNGFDCRSQSGLDLAVLSVEIPESENVSPVEILTKNSFNFFKKSGGLAIGFGWGDFTEELDSPRYLRSLCMELLPVNYNGTPHTFICHHFEDRGPCKGDSGGPLLVLEDGIPKLAGIVRGLKYSPFGARCHNSDNPMEFLAIPLVLEELSSITNAFINVLNLQN